MVLVWEEAVDTLLVTERKEIAIIMCHVKEVTASAGRLWRCFDGDLPTRVQGLLLPVRDPSEKSHDHKVDYAPHCSNLPDLR